MDRSVERLLHRRNFADFKHRRGMATYMGRDTSKLKAKGSNNKWKYMSEAEMLSIASKFSPYRYGTLRSTFPPPFLSCVFTYAYIHIYELHS